ncbi:hypothetical protein CTEN210_06840 [Chaetoceros tenuissimus]|uniref:Uncharacterized protein n=1 Tax=Chaetoceros tenuissimus TaxID=426638 RepID=A0AAD3CR98_9STRA|nr:hypothetical protein CTEN210_06840 [Chaetoceros tenuissimus]
MSSSIPLPTPSIVASQIVRCVTASVSCVASSILALMIWNSETGLQSPYSRIIFGLLIGDIINSLAVLISPFASPSDNIDKVFSIGNVRSCEVTGLFLYIGGFMVPYYTLFLTYYFLKRVKYKVTPQDFAKREERYIRRFIMVVAIVIAIVVFIRGDYNAAPYGSMCAIAPRPFDCIAQDREECTRGKYADMTVLFAQIIPYAICFTLLVYILSSLTRHVYVTESQLTPIEQGKGKGNDNPNNDNNAAPPTRKRYESVKPIAIDPLNAKRLEMVLKTRKETESSKVSQEHSFHNDDADQVNKLENGNVHREPNLSSLSQQDEPQELQARPQESQAPQAQPPKQEEETIKMKLTKEAAKQSILYPKVQALKKLIPELPIFICFILVVLHGGEVPSVADLLSSTPNADPMQQEDEPCRQEEDEAFEENNHRKKKKKRDSIASWIERLGWGDLLSYDSSDEFDSKVERAMREFEAM